MRYSITHLNWNLWSYHQFFIRICDRRSEELWSDLYLITNRGDHITAKCSLVKIFHKITKYLKDTLVCRNRRQPRPNNIRTKTSISLVWPKNAPVTKLGKLRKYFTFCLGNAQTLTIPNWSNVHRFNFFLRTIWCLKNITK